MSSNTQKFIRAQTCGVVKFPSLNSEEDDKRAEGIEERKPKEIHGARATWDDALVIANTLPSSPRRGHGHHHEQTERAEQPAKKSSNAPDDAQALPGRATEGFGRASRPRASARGRGFIDESPLKGQLTSRSSGQASTDQTASHDEQSPRLEVERLPDTPREFGKSQETEPLDRQTSVTNASFDDVKTKLGTVQSASLKRRAHRLDLQGELKRLKDELERVEDELKRVEGEIGGDEIDMMSLRMQLALSRQPSVDGPLADQPSQDARNWEDPLSAVMEMLNKGSDQIAPNKQL